MAKGEKVPNVDSGKNEDGGITRVQYSNGPQHYYDVDVNGKKTHISEDKMLDLYGYGDKLPKQPLTLATAEDFMTDTDAEEPEELVANVGGHNIRIEIGRKEPDADEPDADEEKPQPIVGSIGGVDIPVMSIKVPELSGKGGHEGSNFAEEYRAKAEEFVRSEKVRSETIHKLQDDILRIIEDTARYERDGDEESLEKAQAQFLEFFSDLAKLQGWSEEYANERLDAFIDLHTFLVGGGSEPEPGEPEPSDPLEGVSDEDREKLEALSKDLATARKRLAELNVKASGRMFQGKRVPFGRKLRTELEEARDEWNRLQVEAGSEALRQIMIEDEGDVATLQDRLAGLALQGANNEAMQLAKAQSEVEVKGFMNWYANKYNSADKRWKKALWLAPGGLVAGLAAGTIIGAVGGGIFAGLVARGAVRGALSAKMRAMRDRPTEEQIALTELTVDPDLELEEQLKIMAQIGARANVTKTQTEVSKNAKDNLKKGALAVSIGAAAGIASGMFANWATDQSLTRGSGVGGKYTGRDPFGGRRPSIGKPAGNGAGGNLAPSGPKPDAIQFGVNPKTGDLFRSDIRMPVLDGKGFISDVESAGLVPKGYGKLLADFFHQKGLDNGAHIPGFKDMRMFHTATGYSPWSTDAAEALKQFKTFYKLP